MPSEPEPKCELAQFADMPGRVRIGLDLLQQFMDARERGAVRILGRRTRQTYLRVDILRAVLCRFAAGKVEGIGFYQRSFAGLIVASTVNAEIAALQSLGLISLVPGEHDRRLKVVWPCKQAVQFCNETVPELMNEARELLTRYFDGGLTEL